MLNPAFARWHSLSVSWRKRIFSEPEHVEKSTSKMAKHLKELGIQMAGGDFA